MNQEQLFFDRIEEALDHVIQVSGGRKKVSALLWQNKPMRDAHNHIDACLNPERRERFTPHELMLILRMGREANCHAAMDYIAGECGYKAEAVDPENERARLQREFMDSVRKLDSIRASIERMDVAPMRAVKSA